jgi:hypothetical protein
MLEGMAGLAGIGEMPSGRVMALLAIAAVLAHLPRPNPELVDRLLRPHPAIAAVSAVLAFLGILEVGRGVPASFIYFQF